MIYAAKFRGRRVDSPGHSLPQSTHCYGDSAEAAREDLSQRYDSITVLQLIHRPIIKFSECRVHDTVYRVEDGRLVGHIKPHDSQYQICPKNEFACVGEYSEHITCRDTSGSLVPIDPNVLCILAFR